MEFEEKIEDIGASLMACEACCAEIINDPSRGILPRGLIIESEDRMIGKPGAAIVGINPGRSDHEEQCHFREHGRSHQAWVGYWESHLKDDRYFKRLRCFVDALGIEGPILWGNLAGCETIREPHSAPGIATLRYCAGRYLWKVLDILPQGWILIGAGREAFKALAYRYPNSKVLGCPHPTGSTPNFQRLFDSGQLRPELQTLTQRCLGSPEPCAAWCYKKYEYKSISSG